MGIVEQYILQFNKEKQRLRRATAVLTVLSLLVVITVSWNLRMTGITLANDACCGIAEHQHTADCPVERILICGYPEETAPEESWEPEAAEPVESTTETIEQEPMEEPELPSEEPPEEEPVEEEPQEEEILEEVLIEDPPVPAAEMPAAHFHTEDCYEIRYLCGYEEHVHAISCYSDSTADLETAADWEAALPDLTENWADNLVQVAQSQLGCAESERNFLVSDDGQTRNGITRYGQWYGNPYADWSSLFVMFCLEYAGIPQDAIPWSPGVQNMLCLARDAGILYRPDDAIIASGNILFLDTDGNGNADRSLIVTDSADGVLTAIGGDWDDAVCEISLSCTDADILGYIDVAAVQASQIPREPEEPAEETATPAETIPEETTESTEVSEELASSSDEPEIILNVEFPEDAEILRIVAQTTNIDESAFTWQWQVSADGNDPWTDISEATELVYECAATEENINQFYRLQGRKPAKTRMTFAATRAITTDEETGTITSGAIAPFSIGKNSNVYTVDLYAIPVDEQGNRIAELDVMSLGSLRVNSDTKIILEDEFNQLNPTPGEYHSAYFGTASGPMDSTRDGIESIWRYRRNNYSYYLAYRKTNGTENNRWLSNANNSISLYLRYIPTYTVTFVSDGFQSLEETVHYGAAATLEEPGTWQRDNHTLAGWLIDGDEQTVYTYEQLLQRPVYADATYTAKWWRYVDVRYDVGEYAELLYPVEINTIPYGSSIDQFPTPAWRDNTVAMAFDGWYLDPGYTEPVTTDYQFYEDTTLYAKWSPKDDGYYVYFMDFSRENQTPLVLITYSVTENKTASPYIPSNAPEGTEWDGKWYLDIGNTQAFDFRIPISQMTDHLTGTNQRDLYLYPGTQAVCRAIFITNGTKVDPVTVPVGGTINLDDYRPERTGYTFAGWRKQDGTPVSGEQVMDETTSFYAIWNSDYVPFEAILRTENANDIGMSQVDILGTWYALSGSQIKVTSVYSGTGANRTGTHKVVCVLNGQEYPVYKDADRRQQATLADVYSTYFVYNNTGTNWTDEVNWDDIYTGGELPYSTRPISSNGDTIINFDYMRARTDIVFTIPNTTSGAYIDVYKLYQNGLITGSVTYTGTKPTAEGSNVSATGVSGTNVRWTYTAASGTSGNNTYTLHDMKYGQRLYEVYPVGGSWLTTRGSRDFYYYKTGTGELFSSRREDASTDFFTGAGRKMTATSLTATFESLNKVALMYAVECLSGETADFTIDGVGYKVQTQLCEVVNSSSDFSAKDLLGCINQGENSYTRLNTSTSTIGGTSVRTLFGTTYWDYYKIYDGVSSLSSINTAYIFHYNRLKMGISFNFAYDSNGDGINETVAYDNIAFGESIKQYQYGAPNLTSHPLLEREGYVFSGWMDANSNIMDADDWKELTATGVDEDSTMVFVAKWEKISGNIVEYYEDVSAGVPFEMHYFDDGSLLEYPSMTVYPQGWVWQEYGEGTYDRFDWDVPMYGESGVPESRIINGKEVVVNVIRIYGTWDESHTTVAYDPNPAQGGIPGTAPVDANEYTIWQSEVSVMSQGETANMNPDMVFAGWLLDRDGVVYLPGDHVQVRWPRKMIFIAQWAEKDNVVHLRYHPNGGTPSGCYPNDTGFHFKENSTTVVWNNASSDGNAWFRRIGYTFTGWNTHIDGSGTAYAPGDTIQLRDAVTTLYAQWKKDTHRFDLHKVDRVNNRSLPGAVFDVYRQENGQFLLVESKTTGTDGRIAFTGIETGTIYKLVEAHPPDGYAIMTKEVLFRITPGDTTVSMDFCDAEGNVISAPMGVTGEYISGNRHLMLTVANVAGFELPATGGIGTPLYMLCGVILMFAPFVYGFRMRRKFGRRAVE